MTDVNILLKEYINYSARANAGLMTGTTKKLRQGFTPKTPFMSTKILLMSYEYLILSIIIWIISPSAMVDRFETLFSKMRFEKTGSMKGATKFQDKVQRSKAEKAYERVQYYPDSHQKISDRGFDFTMNTQYLNYLRKQFWLNENFIFMDSVTGCLSKLSRTRTYSTSITSHRYT